MKTKSDQVAAVISQQNSQTDIKLEFNTVSDLI